MDLLIQIAAAGGPIMLAVMGIIVSLSPPEKPGKLQRRWAISFALVGILSFFAIFNEMRGTDQILGQIWEHIKGIKTVSPTAARHLDDEQRIRMKKALKLSPDENYEFQINSAPSCDECELFAQELRDFFNIAPGWTAGGGPIIFPMPRLHGLVLLSVGDGKITAAVQKIKMAFSSAGMPLEYRSDGVQPGSFVILVARPDS